VNLIVIMYLLLWIINSVSTVAENK